MDESSSSLFVQEVCGVSRERAVELLQAGSGSAERAIDIHFHQQQQQQQEHAAPASQGEVACSPETSVPTDAASFKKAKTHHGDYAAAARKNKQSPLKHPHHQASLTCFFGGKTAAAETKAPAVAGDAQQTKSNVIPTLQVKLQDNSSVQKEQVAATTLIASALDNADRHHEEEDERLQYVSLANAFTEMAATTKRLVKLSALQRVLQDIIDAVGGVGDEKEEQRQRSDDDAVVLQCALELALGYSTVGMTTTTPLQVSGSAVSKAVLAVTGASSSKLREAYRKTGDLGDAAVLFVRNQTLLVQPKPLTILKVHETLQAIAAQQGKGSQNQRHTLMVKLLRSCRSDELRFLVRTLLGNMRLGANVRTVLAALAMAVEETDAARSQRTPNTADAVKTVQDTFDICPRLDKVTLALLRGGIRCMQQTCVLEVGTPVNPMLAHPAHSLNEVQKLMTDGTAKSRGAVAEWKYDGMRCQAHWDGTRVSLYSRHMSDITDQFPDAVEAILGAKRSSVDSFILDSEIVGVEQDDSAYRLLPFQDLSTRRGASSDKGDAKPVQIHVFAFDLIYLNGRSMANEPLCRRKHALGEYFQETKVFSFAASVTLESYDEPALRAFLEEAVTGGAEGLMVKLTGADRMETKKSSSEASTCTSSNDSMCVYESGARSQTWLKVKRDYVAGYSDTIDVVPIGAWYGNGRKAQKGFLSPVLLAIYDDEEDVFRSISRCMSFTDAMYNATREFYFYGTEYPGNVGMEGGAPVGNLTESIEKANNEGSDGEDKSFSRQDDDDEEDFDETDRVNCYPSRPSALVATNENPPIWFKPSEVWEVSFADLTLSRTHTAGAGLVKNDASMSRGVALRFPRFKRRRPDKRIDQATTSLQIAQLFAKQSKQGASSKSERG